MSRPDDATLFFTVMKNHQAREDLVRQLVARREERGVSVKDMAEHLELSVPELENFENMSDDLEWEYVVRYVNALGMYLSISVTMRSGD